VHENVMDDDDEVGSFIVILAFGTFTEYDVVRLPSNNNTGYCTPTADIVPPVTCGYT
jgi:hypothetical protein